jgi:hypothetical protein
MKSYSKVGRAKYLPLFISVYYPMCHLCWKVRWKARKKNIKIENWLNNKDSLEISRDEFAILTNCEVNTVGTVAQLWLNMKTY